MFLGFNTLHYNSTLLYIVKLTRRKFAQTIYYGDAILDNVHCINEERTLEELEATPPVRQLWIEGITNYLANFEDRLRSGNIDTDDVPITGWRLKRKKHGESVYIPLKDFPMDTVQFEDWTAANNTEYEYSVHAVSNTVESTGTTKSGSIDFEGWVLTDGETTATFWINLKTSSIPTSIDRTVNDNYTQFATVSYGKRKYKSGTVESMPLTYVSKNYVSLLSDLESIDEFINNGKIKLLKNTKGELWWVDTYNFSHTYSEQFVQNPYTINFEWMQIGDGHDPFVGGAL